MPAPRRIRGSVLLVAAVLSACAHDRAPRADTAASASIAQVDVNAIDEPRATCDSVAAVWRVVLQTEVIAHDTMVTPADRDAGQPLHEKTLMPRRACAVDVRNDSLMTKIDTAAQSRRNLFTERAGWTALWTFDADGPDGSSQTFQRGLVRCRREQEWDGGDDSDSTYVPKPFYAEHTRCWRHDRRIIPSDTARGG